MSRLPRYEKYKDSSVEWLGEVPEHWKVDRMKWSVAAAKNGVWGNDPQGDERDIVCVRVADFDRLKFRVSLHEPTIRNVKPSERVGRVLECGDLLVEKSGGGEAQPVGCTVLYEHAEPAVCSNFISRVKLGKRMSPVFWTYVHAAAYKVALNTRSIKQTSGIQNLDQQQYFDELCAYPPYVEQLTIGAFLERETVKIDKVIEEQQRLITLLKEKRQAVISNAVTKGLDPDAKMKDSGVEWIGEIPDHWSVSKLGYVASERGGKTPSTKNHQYWNGEIPWVSPKDMKTSVISDSIDHITPVAVDECGMTMIPENAVLVVVRGMILAHSFPVAETVKPVTINQDMKALVPDIGMLSSYLRVVLESAKTYVVSVLVAEAAHGTRVLRTDIWKQLPVVLPPLTEQQRIIEHVSSISEKYERLVSQTQRSIDLLKERRSALITAAVTGKVDLRRTV